MILTVGPILTMTLVKCSPTRLHLVEFRMRSRRVTGDGDDASMSRPAPAAVPDSVELADTTALVLLETLSKGDIVTVTVHCVASLSLLSLI